MTSLWIFVAFVVLASKTECNPVEIVHVEDIEDEAIRKLNKRDSEICYGDLGCFRTDGDFYRLTKRPINALPESPQSIDTQFILRTRLNQNDGEFLKYNDKEGIKKTNFDSKKPTKFIVHGFLDNGFKNWIKVMSKEFLVHGDYNVIAVNWGSGSGIPYLQATANTRVVGAVLARFIKYLNKTFNLTFENTHIIGHSLGGHIAGYAGERISKVSRISGLDPAEPYFDGMPRSVRLDETDAKFVDVMHTDDSSIIGIGYGTKQRSGHVDFFPNNGDNQPGCDVGGKIITYIVKGLTQGIRKTFACDHLRVLELFSDSINSKCPFTGFQCSSWEDFKDGKCGDCGSDGSKCAKMGFYANRYKQFLKDESSTAVGSFFLKTSSGLPFCVYNYQVTVKLENHPKSEDQRGYLYVTITGNTGKVSKVQLTESVLTMEHTGSYTYLMTDAVNVGIIKSVEFEWDYESNLLDPTTWEINKRIFGRGIKLYVRHIEVNQMDITLPEAKKSYPSIFCANKNEPISQNTATNMYPNNNCF